MNFAASAVTLFASTLVSPRATTRGLSGLGVHGDQTRPFSAHRKGRDWSRFATRSPITGDTHARKTPPAACASRPERWYQPRYHL